MVGTGIGPPNASDEFLAKTEGSKTPIALHDKDGAGRIKHIWKLVKVLSILGYCNYIVVFFSR